MRLIVCFSILILCFLPVSAQAQTSDRVLPGSQTEMQLSFSPLVKRVSPAVVNIHAERMVERRIANPFMNDPFFAPFFERGLLGGQMRRHMQNSLGSGVIIESGGLVVTNAHVIKGAEDITVGLNDGREFTARLALLDEPSDLALLRIDPKGEKLPFADLKPSETLEVGDLVLAIGNPFGVGQTVTSGIVSALARSNLSISDFNFFIQTDAAINPGNSGGPLVALDGGVVGINSAIYSRDGGSLGIGFAIPSEMVATVVAAEKNGQGGTARVIRPWLGVTAQNVTADIAESLGMGRPRGALVAGLHPASPLAKAGVKIGDVLLAVNGREIRDAAEMKFRMATIPIGGTAQITFMRAGESIDADIEAIAPPDDPPRNLTTVKGRNPLSGVEIVNINPAVALELGLSEEQGVAIYNVPRGTSVARFFVPGVVLKAINGREIKTVADIAPALARPSAQGWVFVIESQGRTQQLVIR